MPNRRISLFLLLTLFPVLSGCSGVMQALTDSSKRPSAQIVGVQLQQLSVTGVTLLFDVKVQNNATAALPLLGLDYRLSSGERSFLSGRSEALGSVPAQSSRVVALPAQVEFAGLLAVLSGLRPGQVLPYEAGLTLSVDVPVMGPLQLPMRTQGRIPIPDVPQVSLAGLEWESLSLQEARGALNLTVTSGNQFPMDLSDLSYALQLGGVSMLQGQTRQSRTLEPGQPTQLSIPISLSPVDLGVGAFRILTGSSADYSLQGNLDVSTPFGALDLPFDGAGETQLSER